MLPPGVLLGAHTSISGGVRQAIVRAQALGFSAAQIFVKNNKQWFAPPLGEGEAEAFRAERQRSGIFFFAHNSYLINLASRDPKMYHTSVESMVAELTRADALGLPFIVMHPGSHGGAGETAGLEQITRGLEEVVAATPQVRCRMAIECTAGQGNALGYKLEHLTYLLKAVGSKKRFGICLDTAHLHAAGYNLATSSGYAELVAALQHGPGFGTILGLHLNDSKVPLGQRVDRHAHLGEGTIGLEGFIRFIQDPIWAAIPKVLETPKSEDMHEDLENLAKLAPYLR